jgi:hypothetical protein
MLNRKIFFFALMLLTTVHWDKIKAQTLATAELSPPARPFSFPIQLEMRVPFAPTAFSKRIIQPFDLRTIPDKLQFNPFKIASDSTH